MTATFVPAPPFKEPIAEASGRLSRGWYAFILALYNRAGGQADKVEAAHAAAMAAAPAATQIVASGGLHVGGGLSGNVGISFYRAMDAAAGLPASGNAEGDWAYARDGRKPGEGAGAGTGVPVYWSAGAWIAATSGAAVTS